MSEVPTLHPLSSPDEGGDRRTRWLGCMSDQLHQARYALVGMCEDEGPLPEDPQAHQGDENLADAVHEHVASARAHVRRALDLIDASPGA